MIGCELHPYVRIREKSLTYTTWRYDAAWLCTRGAFLLIDNMTQRRYYHYILISMELGRM